MPAVLGSGIPFTPGFAKWIRLSLKSHKVY
jgi:hypothetical protein